MGMLFTNKIILLSKKRKRNLYSLIIFIKHDIQSLEILFTNANIHHVQLQLYYLITYSEKLMTLLH